MPVYEFKCSTCGKVIEVFIRSTGIPEIECPECGGRNFERLVSSVSVIKTSPGLPGRTCCGRDERCESPPCSSGGGCYRH